MQLGNVYVNLGLVRGIIHEEISNYLGSQPRLGVHLSQVEQKITARLVLLGDEQEHLSKEEQVVAHIQRKRHGRERSANQQMLDALLKGGRDAARQGEES